MPGLNHTGPLGQGPMTGRKMGKCTDFGAKSKISESGNSDNQNYVTYRNGRGLGLGRGRCGQGLGRGSGRGMGRRNRFNGDF